MDRVENSIMGGMPDVDGCINGLQFWIELKCAARPANPSTPIKPKFQPGQIPWIKRRINAGGTAHVLIQIGSGRDARRYLIPGHIAIYKLDDGMTEADMQAFSRCHGEDSAGDIIRTAAAGLTD